jgi:ABC-type lipoprotein export system ATPase subunit
MKVSNIYIRRFKRLKEMSVSFVNETLGDVNNRYLILGDNGSGKTSLLQAIALPLALATRSIRSIQEFDWIGFESDRFFLPEKPYVELTIDFSAEENLATQELAQQWDNMRNSIGATQPSFQRTNYVAPGNEQTVTLILDGDECYVKESDAARFQFLGRFYARMLIAKGMVNVARRFHALPGVFWFDQFRNNGQRFRNPEDEIEPGRIAYDAGIKELRTKLNGWRYAKQNEERTYHYDYLDEIEKLYQLIFPSRKFSRSSLIPGKESNPSMDNFFFLLNDGDNEYDLTEMSGGEQAIFPILVQYVLKRIAHSVVLIDEIDMNLHAPAAQLLVNKLRKIDPTSQFIFTSHSETVSSQMNEGAICRLAGGTLCL